MWLWPMSAINWVADQGEIIDRIEDLVAHELILEAQALRVEDMTYHRERHSA